MYKWLFFLVTSALLQGPSCSVSSDTDVINPIRPIQIDGVTAVASRVPIDQSQMDDIAARTKADWICLVPYGFTPDNSSKVLYNLGDRQWWGETEEGVRASIEMCNAAGTKVILKPQVWSHDGWSGHIDFETEEEWKIWEDTYEDFILFWAEMAEAEEVEIFVIGTELKTAIKKREQYWFGLIEKVKEVYTGQMTYAANWDNYQNITFWSSLDFIGIDAYFPLDQSATPTVPDLVKAWQPITESIGRFSESQDRPVLFTEYGYLSVDGCAYNTWELEEMRHQIPTNEIAQAHAFEALYTTFSDQKFWVGCILWKWFPKSFGSDSDFEKGYTPQGKLAEETLARWYGADDNLTIEKK